MKIWVEIEDYEILNLTTITKIKVVEEFTRMELEALNNFCFFRSAKSVAEDAAGLPYAKSI